MKQITLTDTLALIDSDACMAFDISYTRLAGDANSAVKTKVDLSYADEDLTVEDFIKQADNYGSFFLSIVYVGGDLKVFQLIDDKTGNPL